jgi:hypothetical protein
MAELTTLEEKLGEVLGLAQAAQGATEKVEGMVEDEGIVATLKQMRDEAEETERRCTEVADGCEVGHWAVLGKLNESAGESEISELVEWSLPIQERHFADVKDGSLKLAGEKDPYDES